MPTDTVLERLINNIQSLLPEANQQTRHVVATPEISVSTTDIAKREIIAKLISSAVGLSVSFVITYYGFKWLMNALDPTRKEKVEAQKQAQSLMKSIGVENIQLSEYELCIASNLVDPLTMHISWKDIGGLEEAINDLRETVILPFKRSKLFQDSALIQPPKGVLLYGPPGCGKTLIAKATAKAAGARFINLQVASLVDKWYGESQKRAQAVFSLAMKLQPVIIFIDEIGIKHDGLCCISRSGDLVHSEGKPLGLSSVYSESPDSFLRSRTSNDHEATAMIKTQFMSFWDGLMTDSKCQVMIMGATNRPNDVDAAILRRMPSMFHIGLPGFEHRKQILDVILRGEPVDDSLDKDFIGKNTAGFSGSDLKELCRTAALYRVRDYLTEERQDNEEENFQPAVETASDAAVQLRKIDTEDFTRALNKLKDTKTVASFHSLQQIEVE